MADKEISELTLADELDGTELVHVVQNGNSRKALVGSIAGAVRLDDLLDVDAYEPADGDTIVFDSSAQAWVNVPAAAGGFQGEIDASTDPVYPPATAGQYWVFSDDGFIGGFDGKIVKRRDILFAVKDSIGGFEADVGTLDYAVLTPGSVRFIAWTNCGSNPNYPDGTPGDYYKVVQAGRIGGPSGPVVAVGDWFVCEFATPSGDHAAVGTNWSVLNFSGANLALDDLTDVEIDTPADGDILRYDASSELWLNATLGEFNQFLGGINCSGNPPYPAAVAGDEYYVSLAGKIGGASGANVLYGDRLKCLVDSAEGDHTTVGINWTISKRADAGRAGTRDCSGNPNYPAAMGGDYYEVIVAGKIGGASGRDVGVGDVILCTSDNAGGTQAAVGTQWLILVEKANANATPALDDLTDVDVSGASDGDTIAYDASSGEWLPTPLTGGSYTDEDARDAVAAALVEGNGIEIVIDDDANSMTFAVDPEYIRDTIGAALVAGDGITITLNDPGDTITISADYALTVEDEGSSVDAAVSVIDFTGAGVTVTQTAAGQVQVAIAGVPATHHEQEWACNFTDDGDVYIAADEAMTISQGNAAIGTGTLAYEKSTSAAPSTFSSTTLPATLQAGAWLKVSATGVSGFKATHLVRTA